MNGEGGGTRRAVWDDSGERRRSLGYVGEIGIIVGLTAVAIVIYLSWKFQSVPTDYLRDMMLVGIITSLVVSVLWMSILNIEPRKSSRILLGSIFVILLVRFLVSPETYTAIAIGSMVSSGILAFFKS